MDRCRHVPFPEVARVLPSPHRESAHGQGEPEQPGAPGTRQNTAPHDAADDVHAVADLIVPAT